MTFEGGEAGAGAPTGGRARVPIALNGEERRVAAGLALDALVRSLGLDPQAVMVERNREIVERADLARTRVEGGDRIEVVQFVGGG